MLVRSAHAKLPPALREPLELVVSELATNAITHAGTPFEVCITTGPTVRVEVYDGSTSPPVLRRAGPADAGGRG